MGSLTPQGTEAWALAARQHGVIAHSQLVELGLSARSIRHRIAKGRLHPVWRGVYAVGRPALGAHGRWMAAVLSCGPRAALSHLSAAALWEIRPSSGAFVEVSVPARVDRRHSRIVVHRRAELRAVEVTRRHGILVTTPVCTLVDLAARLDRGPLAAAIREADKRDLTDPLALRAALDDWPRRPGLAILKETLDRHTFALTDSELERRLLPIARLAGLPLPRTGTYIHGFKVDFWWPDLGLVVETDGLRYHRTPAQQARDRQRDHAHVAAGLTPLRFTHAQVRFEPGHVQATLAAVARRLRAERVVRRS